MNPPPILRMRSLRKPVRPGSDLPSRIGPHRSTWTRWAHCGSTGGVRETKSGCRGANRGSIPSGLPHPIFREENPGYDRLMTGMVLEGADRDLIEGCRRGERDAFRALFETYQDKIYSIALRFSGDEAQAMDIAQDTFLKLFSSMAEFRGDSTFGTWVYRLVVNSCLDYKRRSRRGIPLETGRAPGRERT